MRNTTGWMSTDGSTTLERVTLERRDLRTDDIAVRVDFCGVCHSDLHVIKATKGTVVPGHEFTGTVTQVGPSATRFAVGDLVAVGAYVDSCEKCEMCRIGEEIYCTDRFTPTYGGTDRIDGTPTKGAYSREYIVREGFAYPLPANLDPAAVAPLMCAGVTVWGPLKTAAIGRGSRVAVAGLGGLGHLAVKFAVALGAEVTVLTRTGDKADDAHALGAREPLLVTTDDAQMTKAAGTFDLVIDTIPATHDPGPLLRLLTLDGTLSMVGIFWEIPVNVMNLMLGRKKLTSSATGGRAATAAMLDFCAEHQITADVEVLPSTRVDEALDRLKRGDVHYRFVLDLADLD